MFELSLRYQDVDFIIKIKWEGEWHTYINRLLSKQGYSSETSRNLFISSKLDPQKLIINSHVVTGVGSTALLEAAIAKKQVVIPIFDELSLTKYKDMIFFNDQLSMFNVANSKIEFVDSIETLLQRENVDQQVIAERNSYFEKMVSSLEGNASKQYANKIREIVAASGKRY